MPKAAFKGMPLFGKLCDISESIYMPKGGSKEKMEAALSVISERQESIETTGKYSPFVIFAEGTTSNGTGILKFRRGAFNGLKRVSPTILKYRESNRETIGTLSLSYDVIEFFPLGIF